MVASKLTFFVRDRIRLSFSVDIKLTCFSVGGSKLTVCGPKYTCFWCGDRLTCFLCGWSKLTRFLDAGNKSLGFSMRIEIDIFFLWVVDIDMISVWGIDP